MQYNGCKIRNVVSIHTAKTNNQLPINNVTRLLNSGHDLSCVICNKKVSIIAEYKCNINHKKDQMISKWIRGYFILIGNKAIMMTVDHILPKSLGGSDRLSNLQVMCEHCNNRRHNMLTREELSVIQQHIEDHLSVDSVEAVKKYNAFVENIEQVQPAKDFYNQYQRLSRKEFAIKAKRELPSFAFSIAMCLFSEKDHTLLVYDRS